MEISRAANPAVAQNIINQYAISYALTILHSGEAYSGTSGSLSADGVRAVLDNTYVEIDGSPLAPGDAGAVTYLAGADGPANLTFYNVNAWSAYSGGGSALNSLIAYAVAHETGHAVSDSYATAEFSAFYYNWMATIGPGNGSNQAMLDAWAQSQEKADTELMADAFAIDAHAFMGWGTD